MNTPTSQPISIFPATGSSPQDSTKSYSGRTSVWSVLKFEINRTLKGNTSVTYDVKVYCDYIESGSEELVFDTNITFVNIDENGNKQTVQERPGPASVTHTSDII